jgi:hypothetical protein
MLPMVFLTETPGKQMLGETTGPAQNPQSRDGRRWECASMKSLSRDGGCGSYIARAAFPPSHSGRMPDLVRDVTMPRPQPVQAHDSGRVLLLRSSEPWKLRIQHGDRLRRLRVAWFGWRRLRPRRTSQSS